MNKSESFLKYSTHADKILGKYSLTRRTKSLLMRKNILPCVHGWMIFMDKIWMNFILNVANKCFFAKNWTKNKVETIVSFFQKKSTNEMFKSQFKAMFHISLIWNTFKLWNIYTTHNVKLNLIDPTNRYVPIWTLTIHHQKACVY
jgi:hypothetical protein